MSDPSLILSRLPKQEWFSVGEAAFHTGWGRTHVVEAWQQGKIVAQVSYGSGKRRRAGSSGKRRPPIFLRFHRNDLAMFIAMYCTFDQNVQARNIAMLVAKFPAQLRKTVVSTMLQFVPEASASSVPKVLISLPKINL